MKNLEIRNYKKHCNKNVLRFLFIELMIAYLRSQLSVLNG